jgi:hypothetical protein
VRSIRGFFCAILLTAAAGCGGSTSAETVSPADEEGSVADLQDTSAVSDGSAALGAVDRSDIDSTGDYPESLAVESATSSDADEPSLGTEDSVEGAQSAAESTEPEGRASTTRADGEADVAEVAEPEIRLHSQVVLGGAVTLDVPVDFHALSHAQRENRYAAGQRPSQVLANSAGDVNIAFNLTPNEMTLSQLLDFQRQMAALFRGQVDDGDWIGSSTTNIAGLDWFTIEMRTEAFGTKVWNLIAGTSCNGRLLLISFNATTEHEGGWKGPCRKMLESVRLAAEPLSQPEISAAK